MLKKSVHVVDYGMGNLRSVTKAFEHLGYFVHLIDGVKGWRDADHVILPGVGAIGHCRENLDRNDLIDPILEHIRQEKPFLGICLGMQVLFDSSEENLEVSGLGVLEGQVLYFDSAEISKDKLKVPHMGWNNVEFDSNSKMFSGLDSGTDFYFVHSYYVAPKDNSIVSGRTDYGHRFCSAVERDNVWACQFHPEKSQKSGLALLDNFMKL